MSYKQQEVQQALAKAVLERQGTRPKDWAARNQIKNEMLSGYGIRVTPETILSIVKGGRKAQKTTLDDLGVWLEAEGLLPLESEKPTLHQSQIGMLSRCGLQYQYRYVEGKLRPPGVAMVVGTATHRAVEENLENKIHHGELLSQEEVESLASDAFDATWLGDEPELSDLEKEAGKKATKGVAKDKAVQLSSLHHSDIAPILTPETVEEKFRLELIGRPVDLAGTIDIVEKDGDSYVVRDTKTSGKTPSADTADRSTQLTMYALAVESSRGKRPEKVTLDYLVKLKKPKSVVLESTRGDEDYQMLMKLVDASSKVIEAGAFMPAPQDAWWCSNRWCGYWNICPYGARGKTSPNKLNV